MGCVFVCLRVYVIIFIFIYRCVTCVHVIFTNTVTQNRSDLVGYRSEERMNLFSFISEVLFR